MPCRIDGPEGRHERDAAFLIRHDVAAFCSQILDIMQVQKSAGELLRHQDNVIATMPFCFFQRPLLQTVSVAPVQTVNAKRITLGGSSPALLPFPALCGAGNQAALNGPQMLNHCGIGRMFAEGMGELHFVRHCYHHAHELRKSAMSSMPDKHHQHIDKVQHLHKCCMVGKSSQLLTTTTRWHLRLRRTHTRWRGWSKRLGSGGGRRSRRTSTWQGSAVHTS